MKRSKARALKTAGIAFAAFKAVQIGLIALLISKWPVISAFFKNAFEELGKVQHQRVLEKNGTIEQRKAAKQQQEKDDKKKNKSRKKYAKKIYKQRVKAGEDPVAPKDPSSAGKDIRDIPDLDEIIETVKNKLADPNEPEFQLSGIKPIEKSTYSEDNVQNDKPDEQSADEPQSDSGSRFHGLSFH